MIKTILITGSTDGIGKQTAFELASAGHKVIIHGRKEQRAKAVYDEIANATGNNLLDYVTADLSSLGEVRQLAEDINSKYDKLDVLLNNAGVFYGQKELSADGYEMTFAVNHLAHFLLTNLLLDTIKKADNGRIVTVSSMAHSSDIDFDNLQGEKFYDGYTAYACSKLCNILFTFHLAKMLAGTNVTANCLHPGVISTKLLHAGWGMGGGSLKQGAETSVYLAISKDVENISGKYFVSKRAAHPAEISYDIEVQKRLWEISLKMSGL
jgi:NAD(P)-dependent dehydrogenase (short-subunit alcohol dehydrogenase family)